jgi:phosphate starvation-inducible PhoH-like protein
MSKQRHSNRRSKQSRQQKVESGEKKIIKEKFEEGRKRPPIKAKTQAQKLYLEYLNNKRMGNGAYETNLKDALTGNIEIQEVESIRGRSFDEKSMLIIEEAQQCTIDEIQSICSRVSDDCQLIISGDPKQKDIKGESGLEWLCKFVKRHDLQNVGLVHFTTDDCVRGGLVKDFLKGMDKDKGE